MQIDNLVLQFKKKDPQAFEALYKMYSESIQGVIFTIVKNTDVAEEILQDVFLKAWNNAHTYSEKKGRFFTWVLNIARNAAIDKVRSKSYKNNKKNLTADYFVDILENEHKLDDRIDAIGIKKFVTGLKEKCIQLIELLYFKGFTQKEASEELNIPIGTIKTRNRSCISKLRENVLGK
jgi:RNA polymerase sigma-70 factor (ECF subfamily)